MNSSVAKDWSLHTQLAHDTVTVGDFPLARVLLVNDANYPWLILVPRLPGLVELIDLEENAQVQLLGEITAAAHALKSATQCDKLNIATLGNQVPQWHVHVIARRQTDAAWPRPVWGMKPPLRYKEGQQAILLNSLRELLKPCRLVGMDR
ncbi:MAG TPA: HIT family protein [Pseudolabrys sp.]|nr:HIT family protein [Pseudolabrys sp.]